VVNYVKIYLASSLITMQNLVVFFSYWVRVRRRSQKFCGTLWGPASLGYGHGRTLESLIVQNLQHQKISLHSQKNAQSRILNASVSENYWKHQPEILHAFLQRSFSENFIKFWGRHARAICWIDTAWPCYIRAEISRKKMGSLSWSLKVIRSIEYLWLLINDP